MAASHALRSSGLPLLNLFDTMCPQETGDPARLVHLVYNQAMISVVRTGRNPTMRHLGRVHGVCIGFMHEQFDSTRIAMSYIPTSQMAADIYTKEFTDSDKWYNLCRQIGLYEEESINAGDLLSLFLSPIKLRSEKREGGVTPSTRRPRSHQLFQMNYTDSRQRSAIMTTTTEPNIRFSEKSSFIGHRKTSI